MPIVLSIPASLEEVHDDNPLGETPSPPVDRFESPPPFSSSPKPPARSASTLKSENQIALQTPTNMPSTQFRDRLSRSEGFGSPPRKMPDIFASRFSSSPSRPMFSSSFGTRSSIFNDDEPFGHWSRSQFSRDATATPSVQPSRTDDWRKGFDASFDDDDFFSGTRSFQRRGSTDLRSRAFETRPSIFNVADPQPFSRFSPDATARPSVKSSPSYSQSDYSNGSDTSADGDGNKLQLQRRGSNGSNSRALGPHYDGGQKDLGRDGSDPFGAHDEMLKRLHQHLGTDPSRATVYQDKSADRGHTVLIQDGGRRVAINQNHSTSQTGPDGRTYENRNGHLFINGEDAKILIPGARPGLLLSFGNKDGKITVNGIPIK